MRRGNSIVILLPEETRSRPGAMLRASASLQGEASALGRRRWRSPADRETGRTQAVPAGRLEIPRVPLLAKHKGQPPDAILKWNAMSAVPSAVDVIVHLHGYADQRGQMILPRHKESISGLDFEPPDPVTGPTPIRTRPTLAILPRGHYFGGNSGKGYSFPALAAAGGLEKLIDLSLQTFASRVGASQVARRRLILTAHSGGGADLLRCLKHLDPDEVHVFDGLYQSGSALVTWATKRVRRDHAATAGLSAAERARYMRENGGAMRVLFRPKTRTADFSLPVARGLVAPLAAVRKAGVELAPWYRVESTPVGHNAIPRFFGWRLLADAGANLPRTSPAIRAASARK